MSIVKSKVSHRHQLSWLLGIVVTVALLAWVFRDISFKDVWIALRGIQWPWLGLGLLTFVASYSVRAWRWGTLLSANYQPGSFRLRQATVFIGFAGNAVLPASAGEVVRAGLFHRLSKIPLGVIIGSIATERLLDAAIALILLITHLPIHTNTASARLEQLPLGWISLIVLLTCGTFLVAANNPEWIAHLVGKLARLCGLQRQQPKIVSMVRSLLSGLDALRKPRYAIVAVVQTFLLWGLTAFTYWTGFMAFGIMVPGLPGAVFLQSMIALAIALPSSPGYVGPFEAAVRFSLEFYGVSASAIVAYALTMRVLWLVGLMVMSFVCAMDLGLSRQDLKQAIDHSNDSNIQPHC
jgi:hypothetical protein